MSELFAPSDVEWSRVSARLTAALRITHCGPIVILVLASAGFAAALSDAAGPWQAVVIALAAGLAVLAAWLWFWADRSRARWGYAERADDLLIVHGIMFRRAVAVPYGRMQYVDVKAGPVDRLFGLASVTLHTASAKTAATIPGLPEGEARRLRNRLTELGEAHGAGI